MHVGVAGPFCRPKTGPEAKAKERVPGTLYLSIIFNVEVV